MTDALALPSPPDVTATAPAVAKVQRGLLWLCAASGAFALIEPSPYEFFIVLTGMVFLATGLRLRKIFLVPIILLFGTNLGYTLGAIQSLEKTIVWVWVLTSWYMAITAVLMMMVLAEDTEARLKAIAQGFMFGALIASLAALAGYFHLTEQAYAWFTGFGRGRGTFKDPNVFSIYLVLPSLLALLGVFTARPWRATLNAVLFLIYGLGLFVSFSRGAWGVYAGAVLLYVMLLLYYTSNHRARLRIVVTMGAIMLCATILLLVLLSIDSVRQMLEVRMSLTQSYDVGRMGRFGRHLLGIDMALSFPFGIAPRQFVNIMNEDPHNSFLNAFMSGGWMAGVFYPALMVMSLFAALRTVTVRTPWQPMYLAFFTTFLGMVLESFIIDVDHWRHFFLLLGAMWGVSVANHAYQRRCQAVGADLPRPPPQAARTGDADAGTNHLVTYRLAPAGLIRSG